MNRLSIAAIALGFAAPAGAFNYIGGNARILLPDESGFESVGLSGLGTAVSQQSSPSVASITASAANGGTLSIDFVGHSFGVVSGFLWYDMTVSGPAGPAVAVQVSTSGNASATGDMAAFTYLRIGSLYQVGNMDVPDYPLVLAANQCSGTEAPCVPDVGQNSWSLTNYTIWMVPNRIYPVQLSVSLMQTGWNTSGILGNGVGTASVDPVFTLAPGSGYTLVNSLTPVPEPTSWALLIAGFGLTGAALRRRPIIAAL